MKSDFIATLNFDEKGLIPAVIQQKDTGEVLTLCYMDEEALKLTLETGKVHVFRRSKGRVMIKGESSGCVQNVESVHVDCADNSILVMVSQLRAACHEGYFTCYYRTLAEDGSLRVEGERIFDPKDVYK